MWAAQVHPYCVQDVIEDHTVDLTFKQWIEAEPIRAISHGHPRLALDDPRSHAADPEPLTVGLRNGNQILVDGYHRAVGFWYGHVKKPTLPVFVPRVHGDL
jgi:hypothetical protein